MLISQLLVLYRDQKWTGNMRGGTTGQERLGRGKSKSGPHLLKFSDRVAESLGLFGNSATVHLNLHQLLHKTVTLRVHQITKAPARKSGGRGLVVRRGGGGEGRGAQ